MTAESPSAPVRPRVLIVDDFEDARAVYSLFLKLSGYEPLQAASGDEALAQALTAAPDIILLDLQLPDIDGWEVARRLKADSRTRHIPVIALTAHALQSERVRSLKAGCDGFLPKPCPPPDVVTEINRLLAPRAARARPATR